MHILLFILYGALLGYAIVRIPFFRTSGIRPRVLLLFFILRVGAGCLHNLIAWRYFPNHGDIWTFFHASIDSRHILFTDLRRFVQDNSPWAYLPYNVIILSHLLLNFLSVDNLYINTLFFSFFVFAGTIALFRAFAGLFRGSMAAAFTALFIPSTLFWTACMLKDGVVYLLLGYFFFYLERGISQGWTGKRIIAVAALLLAAIFFRGNILVTLLPALLIWAVLSATPRSKFRVVLIALAAAALASFLLIPAVSEHVLGYVAGRQKEFQVLYGHSRLYLPLLEPTLASLWHTLPAALLNGLLQPLPGSGGQAVYVAFSVELLLIWAIALIAMVYSIIHRIASHGSSACCIFFALSGMLLIGYSIPFAGTIVRYRSLYLPFLLAPAFYALRATPAIQRFDAWLDRAFLRRDRNRNERKIQSN